MRCCDQMDEHAFANFVCDLAVQWHEQMNGGGGGGHSHRGLARVEVGKAACAVQCHLHRAPHAGEALPLEPVG